MAITAADIQNVSFSIDRKGYDVDEVDVFLERVADEIDAMNKEIAELRAAASAAAAAPAPEPEVEPVASEPEPVAVDVAPAGQPSVDVAALKARIGVLETELAEKQADGSAIAQALIVAQRAADDILAKARTDASNIIKDADDEADRIVGKAESDRQRTLDAIRQLEADRSEVRGEYRTMLANFVADAQKKLAEINGDSRRAAANAQARAEAVAATYAAPAPAPAPAPEPAAPAAAAPQVTAGIDKDFSGYGDVVADFEFDDID